MWERREDERQEEGKKKVDCVISEFLVLTILQTTMQKIILK